MATKGKHGGGMPTKYTKEKVDIINSLTEEMLSTGVFISRPKLCLACGVSDGTLDNWAKAHVEWAAAFDRFTAAQKDILLKGGLSGEYNAQFTKFVLSASYGMQEKAGVQLSGDKNEPIEIVVTTK